jgi:arylsulfatase
MKRTLVRLTAALAVAFALPAMAREQQPEPRPNFLVIVADDLGFSDIGAFGGEIETPSLDALAARGLKLTGFHTSPTCSVTRSMLLTGLDNHEAGLGNMAELLAPNQVGKPGHEGYLRPDTASLAELLSAGGYRTHYSGKWHLGVKPEQAPHSRGFQTSFALLQGGSNHFGADLATADGSVYTPTYLENGRPVTRLPADFYSSDYFAGKLVEQLKAAKAGPDARKPFFAYLAFTAPHWPLQAPRETIAKYKGRYDAGYEALRQQRLKRQAELGLLDPRVVPHEFDLAPRWDALTPEQKALSSRRMEVYAAMVDRLDWNVGRVIQALKDTGELDNTVILFLSDNGAEGSILSGAATSASRERNARADNSLDNIGAANSYDAIGPGWAEAATAPSWRFKAFETEGGTRVVSFLTGPGIRRGVGTPFTSVMDVVPTFLDLAGVAPPKGSFDGRTVKPIRGQSWARWLGGRADRVYAPDKPIGGELFGGRALRQGDWKLLDRGDGQWHLFNIARDPGETQDLSAGEPKRKAALLEAWEGYAGQVGVVLPEGPQRIVTRPSGR